jgi:hypothetical protein
VNKSLEERKGIGFAKRGRGEGRGLWREAREGSICMGTDTRAIGRETIHEGCFKWGLRYSEGRGLLHVLSERAQG